ncbi:chromosomal replication initiator protein DnaA [Aureimonas phyllosphaerae]|uniref:Chromosomal replication initiator protein DnaA n=1 Tax=Aureimonas phyllosphaerae TaxID=1166078 RepID=A0A7W6BW88_9HYPH|nr:chromosomal replication initiator protein DnaA [Aureimonas phyllosphaerae]MBB3937505.1 chromosomal replication initiator protein [Aureimonas phyllosphaerae]MBB3961429.1 chromosomal replication initiator protein [Aureimonas phyllosphaerae]
MAAPARDETAILDRVNARLKAQLGPDVFASWFARLKLEHVGKGVVQLSVPTAFLKSWINGHYRDLLLQIFAEEVPGTLKVDVAVRSAVRGASVPPPAANADQPTPAAGDARTVGSVAPRVAAPTERTAPTEGARAEFGSPLDPRYVFSTFVEGASNRVALAAARSIAENGPQSVRFNPLFLHASVGLGKTHLLQAIANAAVAREDKPRVVYLTAEYFMWRFATAIRDNQALDFKENLRGIDILIIDDMQFLQGKSIQQEFCHLLNALIDSARQVIVAADRPAFELESLDSRVRSRLSGGVAIEMVSPDYEMRRGILASRVSAMKAGDPSFAIPETVVDTIARRVVGSGRDLEGAFNQIAFRHAVGQPLSAEHLDDLLNQLTRAGGEKRVRIEDILKFVSRHYNVSRTDILSARRTRTIVRPRQIAMYLAKTMTPRSLPEIGRRFGGRDHTTVLHAVRKIEAERAGDEKLSEELDVIRRMIEE